jgi:hypothetical protein
VDECVAAPVGWRQTARGDGCLATVVCISDYGSSPPQVHARRRRAAHRRVAALVRERRKPPKSPGTQESWDCGVCLGSAGTPWAEVFWGFDEFRGLRRRLTISGRRSERHIGPPLRTHQPRGTALVPTATSNASRSSTTADDVDAADAHGRIYIDSVRLGAERSRVQISPPRLSGSPLGKRASGIWTSLVGRCPRPRGTNRGTKATAWLA